MNDLKDVIWMEKTRLASRLKKKRKDATDTEFNKLLEEFLIKKAPMLRRLAKK